MSETADWVEDLPFDIAVQRARALEPVKADDGFPDVLAALENAQAGAFMSVEALRALVRELHRLYQECAALRRLDGIENAARTLPPGFRT